MGGAGLERNPDSTPVQIRQADSKRQSSSGLGQQRPWIYQLEWHPTPAGDGTSGSGAPTVLAADLGFQMKMKP